MGCDIHFVIERQETEGWREVPYFVEPWTPREKATTTYDKRAWARIDTAKERGIAVLPDAFRSRDYDLFGLLADVRNGHGFAGINTGDGWPAQFPDRGIPADATRRPEDDEQRDYDVDDANGIWHFGDHSFTWTTLDELKSVDWDGIKSRLRGVVGWTEWMRFRDAGEHEPKSWSGGVTGPSIEILSEAEAMKRLASGINIHDGLHVECFWGCTAREATNDWAGQVLPVLKKIADGKPLRLLISFDS